MQVTDVAWESQNDELLHMVIDCDTIRKGVGLKRVSSSVGAGGDRIENKVGEGEEEKVEEEEVVMVKLLRT